MSRRRAGCADSTTSPWKALVSACVDGDRPRPLHLLRLSEAVPVDVDESRRRRGCHGRASDGDLDPRPKSERASSEISLHERVPIGALGEMVG